VQSHCGIQTAATSTSAHWLPHMRKAASALLRHAQESRTSGSAGIAAVRIILCSFEKCFASNGCDSNCSSQQAKRQYSAAHTGASGRASSSLTKSQRSARCGLHAFAYRGGAEFIPTRKSAGKPASYSQPSSSQVRKGTRPDSLSTESMGAPACQQKRHQSVGCLQQAVLL
jgi:hypothetical protein